MKNCGNPNCPNEATLVARIAGVGDRPMCRPCFDNLTAIGMNLRDLSAEAFVPEWRRVAATREHGLARDLTPVLGMNILERIAADLGVDPADFLYALIVGAVGVTALFALVWLVFAASL